MQSNLSLADMLYSGHLVTPDTFSWNRLSHGQTLMEKSLYTGNSYHRQLLQRTQFFDAACKVQVKFTSFQRTPHIFCGKTKIHCHSIFKCFILTHFSIFTISELSNFSKALLYQVVTLKSPFKTKKGFAIIFVGTNFCKIIQNTRNLLPMKIIQKPLYSILFAITLQKLSETPSETPCRNFLQGLQVSTTDRFDCMINKNSLLEWERY